MKQFSFIAAVLLCFVTVASAAFRPAQPGIGGGTSSGGSSTNEAKYMYGTRGGGAITLSAKWSNAAQTTAIVSNFVAAAAGGYYTNRAAGYYNIAIGGDLRATNNDTFVLALEVNGATNGTLTGYSDYRGASGGVGSSTNRVHVEGIVYLAANTVIRPLWSWLSSTANSVGITDPFIMASAVDTSTGSGSGTVDPTNSVLVALISTGAMTNNPNSWYIWAHPTATNVAAQTYFAQNRGLSYTTNSDDFGGLLQSIFNRGVDGISIRLAASPYYTSHFVVSNTVVITNWFIMEGEGNPVTTIHGKSGMTTPVLQFGDATHFISGICRMNRIRFEGEGTSAGSVGVHVVNCAEPVFEYCEWTGFLMAGLRISTLYNTAWSYADNCWFVQKGANAHGILFDAEPSASVIAQNHFSVKNCIFGNHTTGGSAITVSNRFPGLVIQNSHFRNYAGVSGNGITLYAGGDYKIDGNQFQNFSGGFSVFFADRLAATNYSSTVTANSAWTDGIESGHNELVYIGEYVQNVLMAGNTVRGATATYAAANVGNGAINNFDQKELRVGSISRSNALVYLDSSGIAQPVTLSGLTFSAPTLTATAGGALTTNANQFGASATLTIKDGVLMTNATIYTAVVSGSLNSQGDTTLSGSSGITANRVMYLDIAKKIQTSATVTDTELGYLDNVTSSIQTQLDSKVATNGTAVIATGTIVVTNNIEQLGDGATPGSHILYGTNNVGVVFKAANSNSVSITNVVGLLHKASASVIVLDCNHGNRFQVTNRLGQGTTFVVTNLAQGQEITIKGSADGTSRSVTVVPQLGYLVRDFDAFGVAAALNKAITATNGNTFEINIAAAWEHGTNWADVVTRQATY